MYVVTCMSSIPRSLPPCFLCGGHMGFSLLEIVSGLALSPFGFTRLSNPLDWWDFWRIMGETRRRGFVLISCQKASTAKKVTPRPPRLWTPSPLDRPSNGCYLRSWACLGTCTCIVPASSSPAATRGFTSAIAIIGYG